MGQDWTMYIKVTNKENVNMYNNLQNTIEKGNKNKNCGCLTIARIKDELLPY